MTPFTGPPRAAVGGLPFPHRSLADVEPPRSIREKRWRTQRCWRCHGEMKGAEARAYVLCHRCRNGAA